MPLRYYYGFDMTYLLVIAGMLLCMLASARVNSVMKKYSKVRNSTGMTGEEAARRILNNEGLYQVQIECLNADAGDHYDPRTNTVRLSRPNFQNASVTAVCVAAHECGHAVQHATGYAPLKIRGSLVPVANFGSTIAWPLIIIGLFIGGNSSSLLINLGILAFSLAVLFQIVTLPVEFNASSRALRILGGSGLLYENEVKDTRKVLTAAALTYVAGAASAILQLLRIILLTGGRRND